MPCFPRRLLRPVLLSIGGIVLLLLGYFLVQRFALLNVHTVVDGQFYRSAQPTESLLAKLQKDDHLQTILKLNSSNDSARSRAEAEVAAKLGLKYVYLPLSMSRLPTRAQLLDVIQVLQTAPRPILIHCNAGADRTGMVSTLAAMADGQPFEQARADQLNAVYLHVGLPGEDVAEVFDQFIVERALNKKPATTFDDFVDYVRNDYFPTFYHAQIDVLDQTDGAANVRITNASRWFFARGYDDQYEIVAYQMDQNNARRIIARQPIPALSPGQSVERQLIYQMAPLEDRPVELDVLRVAKTWFSERGSPVARILPQSSP